MLLASKSSTKRVAMRLAQCHTNASLNLIAPIMGRSSQSFSSFSIMRQCAAIDNSMYDSVHEVHSQDHVRHIQQYYHWQYLSLPGTPIFKPREPHTIASGSENGHGPVSSSLMSSSPNHSSSEQHTGSQIKVESKTHHTIASAQHSSVANQNFTGNSNGSNHSEAAGHGVNTAQTSHLQSFFSYLHTLHNSSGNHSSNSSNGTNVTNATNYITNHTTGHVHHVTNHTSNHTAGHVSSPIHLSNHAANQSSPTTINNHVGNNASQSPTNLPIGYIEFMQYMHNVYQALMNHPQGKPDTIHTLLGNIIPSIPLMNQGQISNQSPNIHQASQQQQALQSHQEVLQQIPPQAPQQSHSFNFTPHRASIVDQSPNLSKPKRIILMRHGQSLANVEKRVHTYIPDHQISLTELGRKQSYEAGIELAKIIPSDESVKFWVSPYSRTRETYEEVCKSFRKHKRVSYCEEIRLREQEWGNFQNEEEIKRVTEERWRYGPFYYRFPNGESGSDVYDRVSAFLETLYRNFGEEDNMVLVSHGLTCRLFLMRWYKWPVKLFHSFENLENAQFVIMELQPDGRYKIKTPLKLNDDSDIGFPASDFHEDVLDKIRVERSFYQDNV